MLNLRQLEYFFYVAKYGGFTRAARQLPFSIQQPALSIRVKALEEDLKVKLYQIVGRKFQLTPSGEHLYDAVKPFFESLRDGRAAPARRDARTARRSGSRAHADLEEP